MKLKLLLLLVLLSISLPLFAANDDAIVATSAGNTYKKPLSEIGGTIPAGLITFVITGACPTGWTENTSLAGKTLFGTLAANVDVGGTGGADSITPTTASTSLTAAAQTVNSLTAAAQTISSLTAAAQSFTGSQSTVVVNHTHALATGSGATGNFSQVIGTVDTSSGGTGGTPTQTALGTLSGNPTAGGAANYTPAGTNGTSAVTGTMNSSAVTGTMNSSAVSGTITNNSFDNRSAFVKVIFCSKD